MLNPWEHPCIKQFIDSQIDRPLYKLSVLLSIYDVAKLKTVVHALTPRLGSLFLLPETEGRTYAPFCCWVIGSLFCLLPITGHQREDRRRPNESLWGRRVGRLCWRATLSILLGCRSLDRQARSLCVMPQRKHPLGHLAIYNFYPTCHSDSHCPFYTISSSSIGFTLSTLGKIQSDLC